MEPLTKEKLEEVKKFAEMIGFNYRLHKGGDLTFKSKVEDLNVTVEYIYNYINESFSTYISWNADNVKDTEFAMIFSRELEKAVRIAEKLKEE